MQRFRETQSSFDDRLMFLQEFLRHPREIGSVTPSSRFLERRIVQLANVRGARAIVELGAGTGGTTRAILKAMPPNAKLLIIELNRLFCSLLRRIQDPRLIVHCGDARDIAELTERYGVRPLDAVISGIPFSTIGRQNGTMIVEAIERTLAPGGRFLAYQVTKDVDHVSSPVLGPSHVELELFNIPPVRLFRWEKTPARSAVARVASS